MGSARMPSSGLLAPVTKRKMLSAFVSTARVPEGPLAATAACSRALTATSLRRQLPSSCSIRALGSSLVPGWTGPLERRTLLALEEAGRRLEGMDTPIWNMSQMRKCCVNASTI